MNKRLPFCSGYSSVNATEDRTVFAYDSLSTLTHLKLQEPMQDLSNYSFSQLGKLETQVVEELKKRKFLGISQAREQILHIAQSAGISVKELLSDKPSKASKASKGQRAPVKYRHPDDPTQQWSGRGRKPSWVKVWISSGKDLEDTKV